MKNTLIRTHCKRCGCSLTMLKHSIFGANSLKAELGVRLENGNFPTLSVLSLTSDFVPLSANP